MQSWGCRPNSQTWIKQNRGLRTLRRSGKRQLVFARCLVAKRFMSEGLVPDCRVLGLRDEILVSAAVLGEQSHIHGRSNSRRLLQPYASVRR